MSIYEGCVAVVVDGEVAENIGKIVTVGKFVGKVHADNGAPFFFEDQWEVDTPMRSNHGCINYYQREVNLSKIDDHEIDEFIKETEKDFEEVTDGCV